MIKEWIVVEEDDTCFYVRCPETKLPVSKKRILAELKRKGRKAKALVGLSETLEHIYKIHPILNDSLDNIPREYIEEVELL